MNEYKAHKVEVLRGFSKVLKDVRGRGPENIYIKCYEDELHIHFSGAINEFEKQLIAHYGPSINETLIDLYQKAARIISDNQFFYVLELIGMEYVELECNLDNDKFIYKARTKKMINYNNET